MNSSPLPAVSVIMGAYNAERYLALAIESILGQEFTDFEFLIVDDGSTDNTLEIAEAFSKRDPRVRIVREAQNRGHTAALNRLLGEAKAPLIARADADDIYRPDRFSRQVAFLKAHPDHGLVGSEIDLIDAGGNRISRPPGYVPRPQHHPDIVRALLDFSASIAHPTVMMRRDLLLGVGGYREAFDPAEDYDLWLRLSEVTKLANLPESLIDYRLHPGQLTEMFKPKQLRSVAIARLAHEVRTAGQPDPTQGRSELPSTNELDALFGPGSKAYVHRRIADKIRSLDQMTGEGWEAVLGHAQTSPDRKALRTAVRLLRAGKVAAAARLGVAMLYGLLHRLASDAAHESIQA